MPVYTIRDPQSGRSLTIRGDGDEPTEDEIEELFSSQETPSDSDFRVPQATVPESLQLTPQFEDTGYRSLMKAPEMPQFATRAEAEGGAFGEPPAPLPPEIAYGPENQYGIRMPIEVEERSHPLARQKIEEQGDISRFIEETAQAPIRFGMMKKGEGGQYEPEVGPVDVVTGNELDPRYHTALAVPFPTDRLTMMLPEGKLKDVSVGVRNAAAGFLNFFASPQGVGIAGVAGGGRGDATQAMKAFDRTGDLTPLLESLRNPANRAIAAGFAVDMAKHAPEALQAGDDAMKRGDLSGAVEHWTGGVAQLVLAGLSGHHAISRRKGGVEDASEISKATEVHGDVLSRQRQADVGQVPVEEGRTGVQPQAEGRIQEKMTPEEAAAEAEYLRMEREGMNLESPLSDKDVDRYEELRNTFHSDREMSQSELNELDFLDARMSSQTKGVPSPGMIGEVEAALNEAVRIEGVGDKVVVVDPKKISGKGALSGRIAQWNPETGKIEINGRALVQDTQVLTPEQRKEYIRSMVNEEGIHSRTSEKDAKDFHDAASWAERRLGEIIYTKKLGRNMDPTSLGYEMIRRRIQHLSKIKPTEIAFAVGKERLTLASLDIVDRVIGKAREAIGTKASDAQLEMMDRVQRNVSIAREILSKTPVGAPRREVEDLVGKLGARREKVSTDDAVKAGLEAKSIDDLNAIAEGWRQWKQDLTAVRERAKGNPAAMMEYAAIAQRGQLYREAIEAATNSGSHKVEARVGAEKNLPEPTLDWTKNPEVADWLKQNGPELGIRIEEAVGSPRRQPEKRSGRNEEEQSLIDRANKELSEKFNDVSKRLFPKLANATSEKEAFNAVRSIDAALSDMEDNLAFKLVSARGGENTPLWSTYSDWHDLIRSEAERQYQIYKNGWTEEGNQQSFPATPRRRMEKEDLEAHGVAVDKAPYSYAHHNDLLEQYNNKTSSRAIYDGILDLLHDLPDSQVRTILGSKEGYDVPPEAIPDKFVIIEEKMRDGRKVYPFEKQIHKMLSPYANDLRVWQRLLYLEERNYGDYPSHDLVVARLAVAFKDELNSLNLQDERRPNQRVYPEQVIEDWEQYRPKVWREYPEVALIIDDKLYRSHSEKVDTGEEDPETGEPIYEQVNTGKMSPDEEFASELDEHYARHGGRPMVGGPEVRGGRPQPGWKIPVDDSGQGELRLDTKLYTRQASMQPEFDLSGKRIPYQEGTQLGLEGIGSPRRKPPEMDRILKEHIINAFEKIRTRYDAKMSPTAKVDRELYNAGLEAEYGKIEIDPFEDAIFNLAGMPANEWPMGANERAQLLDYFRKSKGTEHDRANMAESRLQGFDWMVDENVSKIVQLREFIRQAGDKGKAAGQAKNLLEFYKKELENNIADRQEAEEFVIKLRRNEELPEDYGKGKFTFGSPRRGMSKKEAERIEALRKYRELMGKQPTVAPGPASGSVSKREAPRSSRKSASEFFPPPTPQSVEESANYVLNSLVRQKPKVQYDSQGNPINVGVQRSFEPSFKRFVDDVRSKHGDVKSGQLMEAWRDAADKYLDNLSGPDMEKVVDDLGLRRQVYGSITSGGGESKISLERKGTIAGPEVDVGGIELSRAKALERAARLNKKADQMIRKANSPVSELVKKTNPADYKRQVELKRELKQKAEILKRTASNLEQGAKTGEGLPASQMTLLGGPEEAKPADWRDPVKGAQRRNRERAKSAIFRKLMEEAPSMRDGLNRATIGPEDIRWDETGGDILKVQESDLNDLEQLGMELTRDAGSNAATQRTAAGGRYRIKQEALPRSATKRVVALRDKRTGKIHLVSAYRDGRRGPVFLDPGSATREHRTLKQLIGRYDPMFSLPLDMPVHNFHQVFESVGDMHSRFSHNIDVMARRVGWRGIGTEPRIEGTEGLEGEGGSLQGPEAEAYRIMMGMVDGARSIGAELTPLEARNAYKVFSVLETRADAERMIKNLRERASKNQLTPKDWTVITAMTKVNDALIKAHSEEMADLKAAAKKAGLPFEPIQTSTGLYDETLNKLYDLAKRNETEESFVRSSQEQFAEGRGIPSQAGAQAPQPTGRELTMRSRRAPTDISQAEPGQPEIPTGAEEGRPAGLEVEPQVAPRGIQRQLYRERSRALRTAAGKRSSREAEIASYPSTGRAGTATEPIGLERGETVRYEVPEYKKREIESQINQIADRISESPQPTQPQAPEQARPEQGNLPGIASLRRRPGRTVGEKVSHIISDFASIYDKWMVDRLQEYGGVVSKDFASKAREMIDRQKELYGRLTPLLDQAKRLAGGIETNRGTNLRGKIADAPRAIVESAQAMRAAKWMGGLNKVTSTAATARSVEAIEGTIPVPAYAQYVVDIGRDANLEVGRTVQPVVPGFVAGGKWQRNLTGLGYDVMRMGDGPVWRRWTHGTAVANKSPGVSLSTAIREVRDDWKAMKDVLDNPLATAEQIESINQDMTRKYPKVITHVKHLGRWQEVVHSNLFNYLERTAQRATHVRAFREIFPNDPTGRSHFAAMMRAMATELSPELIRDRDALVRALNGHPTDDYSTGWQDFARMGPQQGMGAAFRMLNQTFGNLMAKSVLTLQMAVQPGELISGAAPVKLGWKNYLRAARRLNQLYDEMELTGSRNRIIHDWTFQPNSPFRSIFRIAGNVLSKLTMQSLINELQEGMAAATARVVTENIVNGRLSKWEKEMLPRTFSEMGFTPAEVNAMMRGDQTLLNQFQRQAAAFLTGGNKALAENSRAGANRLINSIFRFQLYPMTKANQLRKTLIGVADAWRNGTGAEKKAATKSLVRFMFGNTMQGVLTVALTDLVTGGPSRLGIRKEEVEDEPLKFLVEAFLSAMSGPFYLLWRGARLRGIRGMGEQAARAAFPYAMVSDITDMVDGVGPYRDKSDWDKIGTFVANKTPASRAIRTGMAMAGLSTFDQPLDQAIAAFYRWRRDEMGWEDRQSFMKVDERAEFRKHVIKALDAMKEGDTNTYIDEWLKAVDAKDQDSFMQSMSSRKLLVDLNGKELSEEYKLKLQKRIGMDAYNRLEWFDMMLDAAASGAIPVK